MARTWHHGAKARARIGKQDRWLHNEPKAWTTMFKHRKRRAEARKACHDAMAGKDPVFLPLDSKPRIYYW